MTEETVPPIPVRVPPVISSSGSNPPTQIEEEHQQQSEKKRLLKRRSSSRRRNSGVHDRAVPPVQNLRKGLLSPIKITLSDDYYTSKGPIRTDSLDLDTVTGCLLKRSKHIHRFQKRYFSLCISEGTLSYFMKDPMRNNIKVPRGVFQINKSSQVVKDPSDSLVFKVTVHEIRSGTPLKRKMFEEETKNRRKVKMISLFLKSDSEDDVDRWLSAFRSCVNRQQLHKKRPSPKKKSTLLEIDEQPPKVVVKKSFSGRGWFSSSSSSSTPLERENSEIKSQLETCLKQMRELTKESERYQKENTSLVSKSQELEQTLKSMESKHQESLKMRDERIEQLREALENEKSERLRVQIEERRRLTHRIERLEQSQKCGANCIVQ